MAFLLDTSILMRVANKSDPSNPVADRAILELHRRKETVHITAQNLVEFRNAATRTTAVNGLGLSIADAESLAKDFETLFPLLEETPDIFPAWKAVVAGGAVVGKRVHDARLVAVCHVHNVSHLLTFNTAHFQALAAVGPGLLVVDPATV